MRWLVIGLLLVVAACGNAATPSTSEVQSIPPPPIATAEVAATATPERPAMPSPTTAATEPPMSTPEQSPLPSASAIAGVAIDPALLERARSRGSVRIIVMLNIPWRPEGELPNEAAAVAQRQAIADAQRALLDRLAAYNLTEVTNYQFIPSLALAVDAPALEALVADPGVLSIQPDGFVSPSGGTSPTPDLAAPQ